MLVYAEHDAVDDSVDLFVTARTRTQAIRLWRHYAKANGWQHNIDDYLLSVAIVPQVGARQDVHEWPDMQYAK